MGAWEKSVLLKTVIGGRQRYYKFAINEEKIKNRKSFKTSLKRRQVECDKTRIPLDYKESLV